jgi:hypothetical protein
VEPHHVLGGGFAASQSVKPLYKCLVLSKLRRLDFALFQSPGTITRKHDLSSARRPAVGHRFCDSSKCYTSRSYNHGPCDIAEAARCGLDWVGEGQRNLYAFICCKLSADETYRLKGLHNHAMLVTHGTNLVSRPTAFTVQISDHYLGDYAQCCAETLTACPAPTACVRGSQIYPFSGTTITTAW